MKRIFTLGLFLSVFAINTTIAQVVFYTESFETAGVGYSFTANSGMDGQDFFERTDIAGAPDQEVFDYNNYDGSNFIAGEDIDGIPGASSAIGEVLISGIDITDQTSLEFIAAFASGTNIDIDEPNDAMWVEVNVDGSGWVEIGRFEADPNTTFGGSGTLNGQFAEDTNGDGQGDGNLLTGSFTDFTFSIPATGSSMDVRISMSLDSGDEEGAFDNVRIAGVIVAPVEFTNFMVDNTSNYNNLTWQTASEINNSHFNVQYSIDGDRFETIGKVEGNGNSNRLNNYSFDHTAPSVGLNYYRLEQVDYDGAKSYSKTVKTNNSTSYTKNHSIQSNVVSNDIFLNVDEFTTVQVKDMSGKTIINASIAQAGSINVSNLNAGIYLVVLNTNGVINTEKIIKQ